MVLLQLFFLYLRSTVRVGEHKKSNPGRDCSDTDCNLGHQDFAVEKITPHPSYNSPETDIKFANDIALVRLKGKIKANSKCGIT